MSKKQISLLVSIYIRKNITSNGILFSNKLSFQCKGRFGNLLVTINMELIGYKSLLIVPCFIKSRMPVLIKCNPISCNIRGGKRCQLNYGRMLTQGTPPPPPGSLILKCEQNAVQNRGNTGTLNVSFRYVRISQGKLSTDKIILDTKTIIYLYYTKMSVL